MLQCLHLIIEALDSFYGYWRNASVGSLLIRTERQFGNDFSFQIINYGLLLLRDKKRVSMNVGYFIIGEYRTY